MTKGDRVDVFGDIGTVVGHATPLDGHDRWLVRWDSDGAVTEVMADNIALTPADADTPCGSTIATVVDLAHASTLPPSK